MQYLDDIIDLIESSIEDSLQSEGSHIIKRGYDQEADRFASLLENAHEWIAEYQKKLTEDTSIQRLKIKYTNNA